MPSDFFWMSYARRRRPQTSTFSTLPPPSLTTFRNGSSAAFAVRSSMPGSRIAISSYRRMLCPYLLWTGGHGLSVTGGLLRPPRPRRTRIRRAHLPRDRYRLPTVGSVRAGSGSAGGPATAGPGGRGTGRRLAAGGRMAGRAAAPPLQLRHDVGHPGPHAGGLGGQHGQLLDELRVADDPEFAGVHRLASAPRPARAGTLPLTSCSSRTRRPPGSRPVFSNPCSTVPGAADISERPFRLIFRSAGHSFTHMVRPVPRSPCAPRGAPRREE